MTKNLTLKSAKHVLKSLPETVEDLLKYPESDIKKALFFAITRQAIQEWLKKLPSLHLFSGTNTSRKKKAARPFLQEMTMPKQKKSKDNDTHHLVSNADKNKLLASIENEIKSVEKAIEKESTIVSQLMESLDNLYEEYRQDQEADTQRIDATIRENTVFQGALQEYGLDDDVQEDIAHAMVNDDVFTTTTPLAFNIAQDMARHLEPAEVEGNGAAQEQGDFHDYLRRTATRVESYFSNKQAPNPGSSVNLEQLVRALLVNPATAQNLHMTHRAHESFLRNTANLHEDIARRVKNLGNMQQTHTQLFSLREQLRGVRTPAEFNGLAKEADALLANRSATSVSRMTTPRPSPYYIKPL